MRPTGSGGQKCIQVFGLDHEEPIGFAPVGGDLGQEFVWGHAGRGRQMQFLTDLLANGARHPGRGGQSGLVFGNVEVGFVQRQRLDQIGVALEDLARTSCETAR